MGSIFAKENGLANCLLVESQQNVVEALNGNIFLVQGEYDKNTTITDGCLNGIIRKKLMEILRNAG